MARKNRPATDKRDQRVCISSPDVSTPAKCSSFYEKYSTRLESNTHLFRDPLTAANYKERFHHLLCWEEKEHIKQLAER